MATIFLSHSSRDDALASAVESWLNKQGFDDIFVDHSSIRSGDRWTQALRRAGGSCRVVLCLVTPAWLASTECFGEFTAGWYAGRRMIPLISIAGVELDEMQKRHLARVLLEDQGVDIARAGAPAALDLDAHPDITAPLIEGLRAAGALAKVGLDPSVFPIDDHRDAEGNLLKPPFPGLESFGDTDADAAIYYGRSSEIAQVLDDLREFRATGDRRAYAHAGRAYVIQGASGSGKSSLLKAGVLPRLRRERGWVALRSFRWGAEPLLHFAEALAKPVEGRNIQQAPGAIRDRLLNHWRAAKSAAVEAHTGLPKELPAEAHRAALAEIDLTMLKALRSQLDAEITPLKLDLDRPAATVLIPIDQGEEIVRAEGDGADALADYMRAALLQGPEDEPAHYAVVFTVRTDSFHEVQTSTRLEGIGTRLFDLRPLPIYRFAEVIEQPASRYGVEIEPQLVEMLMDDAGGRDALPLLAFTLQRLWRQYEVEKRIRKANYESMGKLLGLIEDAAERALRGFDPAAQQGPLSGKVSSARDVSAQRAFIPALAQVNERGGTVRRVASLTGFDDEGREILTSFEKWRLVVTSGSQVEVAHEALFRAWPRFQRWLEPEKARLEALRGVESAAASWDANGRKTDFISHAGRRLRDVRRLMQAPDFRRHIDRNPTLKDYLREAGRAMFGWRIAAWYALAMFSSLGIIIGLALAWSYLAGYPSFLEFIVGGSITRLLVATIAVCFAYLAAWLRQIALRSGFQSDVIILSLTAIIGVGLSLLIHYSFSEAGYRMLEASIPTMKEQIGIKDVDIGTLTAIILGAAILGDIFNYIGLLALCWAFLQLLAIVTVPFRFLLRKLAERRGIVTVAPQAVS